MTIAHAWDSRKTVNAMSFECILVRMVPVKGNSYHRHECCVGRLFFRTTPVQVLVVEGIGKEIGEK